MVWTQGGLEHCIKSALRGCAVWSPLSATPFDSLLDGLFSFLSYIV